MYQETIQTDKQVSISIVRIAPQLQNMPFKEEKNPIQHAYTAFYCVEDSKHKLLDKPGCQCQKWKPPLRKQMIL